MTTTLDQFYCQKLYFNFDISRQIFVEILTCFKNNIAHLYSELRIRQWQKKAFVQLFIVYNTNFHVISVDSIDLHKSLIPPSEKTFIFLPTMRVWKPSKQVFWKFYNLQLKAIFWNFQNAKSPPSESRVKRQDNNSIISITLFKPHLMAQKFQWSHLGDTNINRSWVWSQKQENDFRVFLYIYGCFYVDIWILHKNWLKLFEKVVQTGP